MTLNTEINERTFGLLFCNPKPIQFVSSPSEEHKPGAHDGLSVAEWRPAPENDSSLFLLSPNYITLISMGTFIKHPLSTEQCVK